MSIKTKLTIIIISIISFTILLFTSILVFYQSKILYQKELNKLDEIAKSLKRATEESIMSEDDLSLISYTYKIKDENKVVEFAWVWDGQKFLSHSQKGMARQLIANPKCESDNKQLYSILIKTNVEKKDYFICLNFKRNLIINKVKNDTIFLLKQIIFISIIVFFIGLIIAVIFANTISRPIIEISKQSVELSKGKFIEKEYIPYKGKNEIKILQSEFINMSNKLKELDEMKKDFVSAVTHELKSPLSAIESYIDILSSEIKTFSNEKISNNLSKWLEDLKYIKVNIKRLHNFISDLLDTAKIERGKFEIKKKETDFKILIEDVILLFKEKIKENKMELKLQIDENIGKVLLDEERIKQVLTNLISNSIKYGKEGGFIKITASYSDAIKVLELNPNLTLKEGKEKFLIVYVEDNGIGIEKNKINQLFGKFEQIKSQRQVVKGPKGTGLGLYITKNIIEAHSGNIWVESKEGEGSRFYFTLPA